MTGSGRAEGENTMCINNTQHYSVYLNECPFLSYLMSMARAVTNGLIRNFSFHSYRFDTNIVLFYDLYDHSSL